ncbi:sucrose phosphorylase [Georgenia faecalis]|uniref:Sucrose phosphorylase n=1 Tax=Georgenia faecalis TaxID=2483799 RepID=A0ABV9D4R8_9MICO|nr:sucrose phosphorylase [Georgenia faecalis]
MGHGVHLLAYADRFGGSLPALRGLLAAPPLDVFTGVHVLPFFLPFDGDDAGFDPIDHTVVDPRLGSWDDVAALARVRHVTADLIVNHVSAASPEFRDWLALGEASAHDGMFLTFDTVFPGGGTEADITAFYRPRAGLPFTPYQRADGTRRLVWTTFMPTQVDLDVHHPAARGYLEHVLRALAGAGVRTVRLDAVGYAVKTAGTDSFMTAATLEFVSEIAAMAHRAGLEVLVEVHAHYTQQLAIAERVDLVYDFALPPLLLHSFGTGTVDRLVRWLEIRPTNAVTVLDTHDGIGVIDAGPSGDRPGLIDHDEMAAIFRRAEAATGGISAVASQQVAWARLPHQINSTFSSVLGADDTAYLTARAVQLFLPGRPQVYYVGLLAGENDVALWERTRVGRDVNRHHVAPGEVEEALERDVVRGLLALVRLRTEHPAFDGEFRYAQTGADGLELVWRSGEARARLAVSVAGARPTFALEWTTAEGTRRATSVAELAG